MADRRRLSARSMALGVGGVVLGLVLLLAFANTADSDDVTELLGRRAPRVAGLTLSGENYDLDDHRGSWVLVNFFATWCPGCVNEHPELVKLEAWGRDRGDVELVAVVFNDPETDQIEQFFARRGGGWPVLDNPAVPVDFQVAQIPETFLVSPAGQIVLHVEGEVTSSQVIDVIEAG